MGYQLHDYQQVAVDKLRGALKGGHKRPVLMIPTGGGKTVVAADIIRSARSKGRRVIFTLPALTLIDQTLESFRHNGIDDIGVIQADHQLTDYSKPVQIASVQTLQKRTIPPADLVLVDECHKQFALYQNWTTHEDWLEVPFIGLSATPWARGMGRLWDHLIIGETTKGLIERGFLSPFHVFAPSHPDLSKVRITAGDYNEGDLGRVMGGDHELTADIVRTWIDKGENRPTFVFAVDCAHGKCLEEEFVDAGVRAEYMDAETPMSDRAAIRRRFQMRETQVVVNIGVLTTGVDWDVRCIVLARPTKSEILYTQIIGRGLRTAPGKKDCRILDHTGTTEALGFVTDIMHTRLSQGRLADGEKEEPERKEPLPKPCPSCARLKPARAMKCPHCGFESKPASDVVVNPGELVELDQFRAAKASEKRNRTETWPEKVSFISQLRAYALDYGMSSGWVAHKYKARYGVWPNDPIVRYAHAADECGITVRAWIKAMNVRYAKSQAAKRGGR